MKEITCSCGHNINYHEWGDGCVFPRTRGGNCDCKCSPQVVAQTELARLEAALTEWKLAYLKLEFDEVTGECIMACGGSAAEGHKDDCQFIEWMPDGNLPVVDDEESEKE